MSVTMMIVSKYITVLDTQRCSHIPERQHSVEAGNMYNGFSKRRREWVGANYIPLQETNSIT